MMSHRPPAARRPILLAALVALATIIAACTSQTSASDAGAHPKLGAAPAPPGGLTLPAIFVDPQGSALDGRGVPCASDLNTGTQATCGGAGTGPLKTWAGVTQLWGCSNVFACYPVLRQNTTITFLSSHTDNTDPVPFTPVLANGAWAAIVGNLGTAQVVVAGVLANVTAKTRATPQLLQASVTNGDGGGGLTGTATAPNLIVNATHSSKAWTNAVVSGSTYSISQPLSPIAIGSYAGVATEVDTWANGDTVTAYTPVAVNIVKVAPQIVDFNASTFGSAVYLQNLNILDPSGATNDTSEFGRGVVALDIQSQRFIAMASAYIDGPISFVNGSTGWGFVDTWMNGGISGGPQAATSSLPSIFGGIPRAVSAQAYIDYDAYILTNSTAYQTGFVYVNSGRTLTFNGSSGVAGANSGNFWGTGTVNASGDCRVSYPAGSGKGASTFVGVTLNANGQTKSCLDVPSAAATFSTCNVTLSAANLDSNLGTTTGCLVGPGSAFCNAP